MVVGLFRVFDGIRYETYQFTYKPVPWPGSLEGKVCEKAVCSGSFRGGWGVISEAKCVYYSYLLLS